MALTIRPTIGSRHPAQRRLVPTPYTAAADPLMTPADPGAEDIKRGGSGAGRSIRTRAWTEGVGDMVIDGLREWGGFTWGWSG
jgi:hypothetical protein